MEPCVLPIDDTTVVLAGATGDLGGGITKSLLEGSDAVFPPWQGMQYLRNMLGERSWSPSTTTDIRVSGGRPCRRYSLHASRGASP